jgi:hypothetical protein
VGAESEDVCAPAPQEYGRIMARDLRHFAEDVVKRLAGRRAREGKQLKLAPKQLIDQIEDHRSNGKVGHQDQNGQRERVYVRKAVFDTKLEVHLDQQCSKQSATQRYVCEHSDEICGELPVRSSCLKQHEIKNRKEQCDD